MQAILSNWVMISVLKETLLLTVSNVDLSFENPKEVPPTSIKLEKRQLSSQKIFLKTCS